MEPMRTLSAFLFLVLLARAATLTPFTPTLPFTFEENRGQLSHPATHLAADHGWAFDCSAVYRRARDWRGPDYISRLSLPNPNPSCQSFLTFAAPTVAHYYRGPNRAQWVESVQRFNILAYKSVAPGLDWQYQARNNDIEWRWDVAAGVNPASFALKLENVPYSQVNDQGLYVFEFGVIPHPIAIQLKHTIPARWHLDPETKAVSIVVDNREPMAPVSITISLPLTPIPLTNFQATLDPAGRWLVFSSSDALASLDSRSATCSMNLWSYACPGVLAARFSPNGDLLSVTHLSGARYQAPSAIRSDLDGNIYLAGTTYSQEFPVTEDAAQHEYAGPAVMQSNGRSYPGGDAFLAKLYGPNGALISSTFAGTPLTDFPTSFDIDDSGRPALLLSTGSTGFPSPSSNVTFSALRLNEPFSRFDFNVPVDRPNSIRAAGDGSAWLLRSQTAIDHIAATGELLQTLTLPDGLYASSMALAPGPVLWLSASQTTGGTYTAALARLTANSLDIRADWPAGFVESDALGNVSFLASTRTLPVTPDAVLLEPCGEVNYYARLTPDFHFDHGTFLPPAPNPKLSLSPGGRPLINNGATLSLLNLAAPPQPFLACVEHTAPNIHTSLAPASLVTLRGRDIGPALAHDWQLDDTGKIATTLAGVTLTFAGLPAPILRAEPHRIDAIIPYAAPPDKPITMELSRDGQAVASKPLQLAPRSFAVFRIENEDGASNSADNPAKLGSTIRLLASGAGPTDPPGVDGQVGHPVLAVPLARLRTEFFADWLDPIRFQQAPEWTSGIMEAVFQLPATAPDGASSALLLLELGGNFTHNFPTIYFR